MIKTTINYNNKNYELYYHPDLIKRIVVETNTFFEEWMLTPLKDKITSFDFTIDIGSNIGNHAFFFKNICGSNRVVCFEPFESNLELLRLNCSNCEIHEYALSSISETVSLQAEGINNNSGVVKIYPDPNGNVKCFTLDSFNFEGVTFIKIDVEGHEIEVIKGALNTIQKSKPDILVEIHLGINIEDIQNLLLDYSYEKISFENHFLFKYKK